MSGNHGVRLGGRRSLVAAGFVIMVLLGGCGSDGGDSSSDDVTTTTKAKAATTTTAAVSTTAATTEAPTTTSGTPDTATPILKETEIGPLRIGMPLADAQATGWVGSDIGTCGETLSGDKTPGEYGFGLDGSSAPEGLDGSIHVVDDKIAVINIRGGARMANDVTIEQFGTWTPDLAVKALNQANYEITYDTIFEENDLAKVTSPDGNNYELSLTEAGVSVAVPNIEACD